MQAVTVNPLVRLPQCPFGNVVGLLPTISYAGKDRWELQTNNTVGWLCQGKWRYVGAIKKRTQFKCFLRFQPMLVNF